MYKVILIPFEKLDGRLVFEESCLAPPKLNKPVAIDDFISVDEVELIALKPKGVMFLSALSFDDSSPFLFSDLVADLDEFTPNTNKFDEDDTGTAVAVSVFGFVVFSNDTSVAEFVVVVPKLNKLSDDDKGTAGTASMSGFVVFSNDTSVAEFVVVVPKLNKLDDAREKI